MSAFFRLSAGAAAAFVCAIAASSVQAAPTAKPIAAQPSSNLVKVHDRYYDRRYDRRYYRGRRVVRAPFTRVESGGRTVVDAPFAHVYSGRRGTHVEAPFVDLWR